MASLSEYTKNRKKILIEESQNIDNYLENIIKNSGTIRILDYIFRAAFDCVAVFLFVGFVFCIAVILAELTGCIIQLIKRLYYGTW